MKIKFRLLSVLICLLFFMCLAPIQAQEAKTQKFVVHEDVVKPNMVEKYETASKAFNAVLNEHGASDVQYLAVSLDDMRYLSMLAPLKIWLL